MRVKITSMPSLEYTKVLPFVIAAVVWAFDLLTPLGIAVWLFYLVILMLPYTARKKARILFWSLIATGLTLTELFLSSRGGPFYLALINRIMGTTVFWVAALLLMRRLQAEEALADHTVRLERMNRDLVALNDELDEFTNVASHDLQEPLRTLTTFGDLLRKDLGGSLPERAEQDLGFITDAAKRMQALIRDLLALSRAGRAAKKREKVSLSECADQALEALAIRVKEIGAQISRDKLPDVRGDSTLLTELYQNLIGNALKFTGNRCPTIQLTFEERNGDQIFGVKDNGIGIELKFAQEIFKPFSRLHGRDQYEGTGIGLAICHRIVERHGGRIWVESEPGKGAHFRFTIPHNRRKRLGQGIGFNSRLALAAGKI